MWPISSSDFEAIATIGSAYNSSSSNNTTTIYSSLLFKEYQQIFSNNNLLIVSLLSCLIIWIHSLLLKRFKYEKQFDCFNGPPTYPLVGNAFGLCVDIDKILDVIKGWVDTYGAVYRGWLGPIPYIFIAEPKAAEKLLSSYANTEKCEDYDLLHGWLGTGLLTSKGHKWHARRKLLTPAFHFKILDNFIDTFNEQTLKLVKILKPKAESRKAFDISPFIARCALDVICETAMGEKINAQEHADSEYVKAIYEYSELVMKRLTVPYLRIGFIFNLFYGRKSNQLLSTLHSFTENVIQKRKQENDQTQFLIPADRNRSQSFTANVLQQKKKQQESTHGRRNSMDESQTGFYGKRKLAFLDLLLEVSDNGKVLSDLDIREETDTFMFEGHDTTSASVIWTLALLANNPECQEKVRDELREIFGESKSSQITHNHLAQMKYLECCIKESLRLYPSVPFYGRKLTQDLDLGDGKIIPKETVVIILTYLLHRNANSFSNPDQFDPERFFPENSIGRHPYAYVPFSAGPRNCIGQKFAGMEEKIILANILRNYKIEPGMKMEDIKIIPELILRPKGGFPVKLIAI